ncbi:MAG: ATP-dependent helicase HrpB [Actinomycetia bacterium]|nr:ATP-dependent helicase HrpB [Actinomycetes bacterium]
MASAPLHRTLTDLPIEGAADSISTAIEAGLLVLTAEPGAGKTSIVPLLAAATMTERVLLLQPRRLAARAAAQRLTDLVEGDHRVGGVVGLTMRGEHLVSATTRIEVMTEAILTNRLQRDPELPGVGAVIFDEFHERNLHSDLSLAMAIEARATIRDDLAIVVMSATLDPEPVAALLALSSGSGPDVAVIEVAGRTYPVETEHGVRPPRSSWADAVATMTRRALGEVGGDVLVFVPGRREIDEVVRRLSGTGSDVVGLHGGSTGEIRRQVMSERGPRRVVVATAVAETSLTLPRIEAVVDGGLARRAQFDPTSGMGRLATGFVTRFAADQRRGRAGRLQAGRCYRLWSVDEHRHLDDATPPEILDGDPMPLAFELARWGDPEALSLPLLDHPGQHRLAAGQHLLAGLGLVADDGSLTNRGRAASRLGLHPRSGVLLLAAVELGQPWLGATVAAMLDDDKRPSTSDLAAELDQRGGQMKGQASRLLRRLDQQGHNDGAGQDRRSRVDSGGLGALLARAWPDRVAIKRPDRGANPRPGQFLIANGREGYLPPSSPLAGAEFLVVAEADGEARSATIRRAVAIDRATLLKAADDSVEWIDEVVWDERRGSITAERQQRLGAIVLHRQPLASPRPELIVNALSDGLRRQGLDMLPWNNKAFDLRARLAWLEDQAPDQWPGVDDDSLLANLDLWLDLSRCRQPADLARLDVGAGLLRLLDWRQRAALDELAPTRLPIPGGRDRPVDYRSGRPVLSVRLQYLIGLDHHPTVGPGRVPVTIELLSPAGRPAQVTTDLPGFWRGSYAAVRSELRGRYPKHRWPERPWESDGADSH